MPEIPTLVAEYRSALQAAEPLAPPDERSLYVLHTRELEHLCSLLGAKASSAAIAAAVARGRRAFGRSFLSGEHGAQTERAFHLLAAALEALHPSTRGGENGA
jgi:hypothetical protein